MASPIEILLDKVEWIKEKPLAVEGGSGLPHVTHTGKLKILTLELDVMQLSNGKRIISEESMGKFIKWLESGGE